MTRGRRPPTPDREALLTEACATLAASLGAILESAACGLIPSPDGLAAHRPHYERAVGLLASALGSTPEELLTLLEEER